MAAALLLAGCAAAQRSGAGADGFAGAVAADEPRAALVARDVLSDGGNAADAAVALYFALSVTLPSTAGLGGGGVCLIHDPENGRTEALDFLPRAAAGGPVAVPANLRGMAALHARYGRLRWARVLSPAENLARFGTRVSRALAREIATAGDKLLADPGVRDVFTDPDGRLLEEGDTLRQVELAAILARVRQKGVGEFYTGQTGMQLAQAAQSIGAPLTAADLRASAPAFRETVRVPFRNHVLHAAPPPAAGGPVTVQLVRMLTEARDIADASTEADRAHLFIEASARALEAREGWMTASGDSAEPVAELVSEERAEALMKGYDFEAAAAVSGPETEVRRPENPWATGFAVADGQGMAVACNVTMNDLFGSGRMAPETGIILAPAPADRPASVALGPMLLVNEPTGRFFYAAAASGGPVAPTAMADVFLRAAVEKQSLEAAIAAKRLHHNGSPDIVFHEPGESQDRLAALARRGYALREAGILGRVDAIWCPGGLPQQPESCEARSDPRGHGLATILAR